MHLMKDDEAEMAVNNYKPAFFDQLAEGSSGHRKATHAEHVLPSDAEPCTGNWHRDRPHLVTLHLLLYLYHHANNATK